MGRLLRALTLAVVGFALFACGGGRSPSASLGVTQEGAATVAAGSAATYRVVVANPAGASATAVTLNWSVSAPFALGTVTYTCTATGGAECPAAQPGAASMSLTAGSLGAGRSLVYTFSVATPAAGRGDVVAVANVSAQGDGDGANNEARSTTRAVDARSGAYRMYAADGRLYDLTVDFDAGRYTVSGNGTSVERAFAADAARGGYTVNAHPDEHLRTADDLVVGSHAFAAGTLPYLAARSFATGVNAVPVQMNLMSRSAAADGTQAHTAAATARVSGNVLQVCRNDDEVVQAQTCAVGSLKSYALAVSGDEFTAQDTASSASFRFRIARSGAASIVVAANAQADGTLELMIGVPESAGLVDTNVQAAGVLADGRAEWASIHLERTTYVTEGDVLADASGLFRVDAGSDAVPPVAMLQGAPTPVLDGAPIWVTQVYPLVVVVGAPLSAADQANASGFMQIGLP